MTTIYVTKGCLTGGIMNIHVTGKETSVDGMCRIDANTYVHKGDYCFSEQEAIECANILRNKKIASLKKQIAKLEVMDFGDDK